MKARCERDSTEFEATPTPYPSKKRQSSHRCSNGDMYIDCPTCHRRYFLIGGGGLAVARDLTVTGPKPDIGDFVSDRVLTLL